MPARDETTHGTSAPTSTTFKIPVFNGRDDVFQQWKPRILMHLEDAGVLALVEGDEVEPAEPGAQLDKWRKSNVRARHVLMQALGNDLTIHVFDHKTASAAWTSLLDVYEPKSSSNLHSLLRQLTATRWDQVIPMEQHINTIRGRIAELKAIGETISPNLHVAILQGSIEHVGYEAWKALANAVNNLPPDHVTPTVVANRYLAEAERQKRVTTVTSQLAAMSVHRQTTNDPGRGSVGRREKRRDPPAGFIWEQCWKCAGKRHFGRCDERTRATPAPPARQDGGHGTAQLATGAVTFDEGVDYDMGLHVYHAGTSSDVSAFILDSGALEHLVQQKSMLRVRV